MPRTLSDAERDLAVRYIMDVQHILIVRNGGTFVERGVALDDADETTSSVMEDSDLVTALETALRILGWKVGDATPPTTEVQLQAALGIMLPRE